MRGGAVWLTPQSQISFDTEQTCILALANIHHVVPATPMQQKPNGTSEPHIEPLKGVIQRCGLARNWANIDQAIVVTRGVGGVVSVKNDMRVK
jgi:hypothetical protein